MDQQLTLSQTLSNRFVFPNAENISVINSFTRKEQSSEKNVHQRTQLGEDCQVYSKENIVGYTARRRLVA